MRFLVTGGAGFIGSNLSELLLAEGHDVLAIDDLSAGYEHNLPQSSRLVVRKVKVQDCPDDDLGTLDGVFHLAAQASVPLSIEQCYESSVNNLQSSLRVFDWARRRRLPVVYATSSAVYGELPFGDDRKADIDLGSPYAVDKFALELYAAMFHRLFGVPSIGLRFFNVYGPKQDPSNAYAGVICLFIDRLTRNQPVTVFGGHQTRDFIFVSDVTATLLRAMTHLRANDSCSVFNLGTGRSVTISELLQSLAAILQKAPDVEYKPLPAGDPAVSVGSSEKIAAYLGLNLEGFTPLAAGLAQTIEHSTRVEGP